MVMHRNTSSFFFLSIIVPTLLVFIGGAASGGEKPQGYSIERYAVIWQNSILVKSTSEKGNVEESSTHWSLSGVFSFQGGHGAVIVNQTTGSMQQIETGKKNDSGMTLVAVSGLDSKVEPLKVKVANREGETFWVVNTRTRLISSSTSN